MTNPVSRLRSLDMLLMDLILSYSLSTKCIKAATVALLFFESFCDLKSKWFCVRIVRAASSLYGKFGMFNWQETARSVVNHSLSVSESCSLQFECHSGVHFVKLLMAGVSSIT